MTLQPLACQSCGAALGSVEQQDLVKCEYCGSELTVLVAERIEVRQATGIPEAILLAQPLPAPYQPPAASPPPAAPPPPPQRAAQAQSERLDVPPWVGRLLFRAVREIFRRR
jgi:DNA-directed RNA polymerase subunit RPC12/RpoP